MTFLAENLPLFWVYHAYKITLLLKNIKFELAPFLNQIILPFKFKVLNIPPYGSFKLLQYLKLDINFVAWDVNLKPTYTLLSFLDADIFK